MTRNFILATVVLAVLSGCAAVNQSRFNPLNWFGKSEQIDTVITENGERVAVLRSLSPRKGYPVFTDTRPLAPNVATLSVQKSPSGAIITASTQLPSVGYYDAELVPVASSAADVLTYDFRIRPPATAQGTGTAPQRRITVARALSHGELDGIGRIVVRAANGSRQTRR